MTDVTTDDENIVTETDGTKPSFELTLELPGGDSLTWKLGSRASRDLDIIGKLDPESLDAIMTYLEFKFGEVAIPTTRSLSDIVHTLRDAAEQGALHDALESLANLEMMLYLESFLGAGHPDELATHGILVIEVD